MAIEVRYSGDTVVVETPRYTVEANAPEYTVEAASGIIGSGVPYNGPYIVEPTTDVQVLGTFQKVMSGDVTIGAIPKNYGLITWNGSVLTVS